MKVDASAIRKKVERIIKDFTKDSKQMKKAANIIRNEIVEKSREGKGYDGKPYPLLSKAWMDERDYLDGHVSTHKDYNASNANSNLTFTGALLRAIKATAKGNKITLEADGSHKPYSGTKKTRNSTIIGGLQDRGYKILGVHEEAKKRIKEQFRQFLRRKK